MLLLHPHAQKGLAPEPPTRASPTWAIRSPPLAPQSYFLLAWPGRLVAANQPGARQSNGEPPPFFFGRCEGLSHAPRRLAAAPEAAPRPACLAAGLPGRATRRARASAQCTGHSGSPPARRVLVGLVECRWARVPISETAERMGGQSDAVEAGIIALRTLSVAGAVEGECVYARVGWEAPTAILCE